MQPSSSLPTSTTQRQPSLGKLAKQKILADYFHSLGEPDLRRAVRYAAGRPFSATDERVLNVGGAIVSEVALAILKLSPAEYHELVVRSGEIGEALSCAWPTVPPPAPRQSVTLEDLSRVFDDLSATGVQRAKRDLLAHLLVNCTHPREAAYVAKIILGDLRTGVQEGVLQAAVAQAFDKTLSQIHRCQFLVGDLDETAVLARADGLDAARFRLFHPIGFMLATPQQDPAAAADTAAGRSLWAEDKLDGIRAQVHRSEIASRFTRGRSTALTKAFLTSSRRCMTLPGDFLLDGEIVPWSADAVLPFSHLQKRLGARWFRRKCFATILWLLSRSICCT